MGKRIFSIQANNSAMTEFDPAMTGPIAASVARGHEQTTEAMPPADPNRPSGVAATIGVTLKRVPRDISMRNPVILRCLHSCSWRWQARSETILKVSH